MADAVNTPEVWDGVWNKPEEVVAATSAELELLVNKPSWKRYEALVQECLGGWASVRSIEIGAGSARHSNAAALMGASVTVLDYSEKAIAVARDCFATSGAEANFIHQDVFELPPEYRGAFNLAWSFGTAEHFVGERRRLFLKAHVDLVASGGLVIVVVPNRFAYDYRLYMALARYYNEWPFGLEVPFSRHELHEHFQALGVTIIDWFACPSPWFRWQTLDLLKRRLPLLYPGASFLNRCFNRLRIPERFTDAFSYEAILLGAKQ